MTRPDQLLSSWDRLPFATKVELSTDQAEHPPWGRNLTYPLDRYVRIRCGVNIAEPGSLPRFEPKARRFVRVSAEAGSGREG